MEKKIVLASGNQGKAREFSAMLEPLGYTIILQKELGISSPEETGKSFLENAMLKARYASEQSGLPALADDSGLCVDYLNGEPGIYSARFAGVHGDHGSDEENNKKLLSLLKNVKDSERTARYWCALCLVRHPKDPVPYTVMGHWEGSIGYEPVGSNGFGYDPIFRVTGRNLTAAQLPPQIKNLISHRGVALRRLVDLLDYGK
ncbi:MAG: RdgB/HAM1 family non-canonical purine NTP pyrophosphatase [Succinivibrio sp.]|nr:RdgB/HAM1 family non-canonical purine NTP pyrophosphatase [Succinivibrio sp.]